METTSLWSLVSSSPAAEGKKQPSWLASEDCEGHLEQSGEEPEGGSLLSGGLLLVGLSEEERESKDWLAIFVAGSLEKLQSPCDQVGEEASLSS